MKPRILLADDHALVAEGIRRIVEHDFEVVGVAADGHEVLTKAQQLSPDLVVLDIAMPAMNGVEAARRLRSVAPAAKVVFVTQQSDRHYARAAFQAGAQAYVLKQSAATELQTALRTVLRGGVYLSPILARDLPPIREMRSQTDDAFVGGMTPRQREVLQLVAEGKTIKEVAAVLNISAKTVEFHKRGIMETLGLRTTAELTRYALEHGILPTG